MYIIYVFRYGISYRHLPSPFPLVCPSRHTYSMVPHHNHDSRLVNLIKPILSILFVIGSETSLWPGLTVVGRSVSPSRRSVIISIISLTNIYNNCLTFLSTCKTVNTFTFQHLRSTFFWTITKTDINFIKVLF